MSEVSELKAILAACNKRCVDLEARAVKAEGLYQKAFDRAEERGRVADRLEQESAALKQQLEIYKTGLDCLHATVGEVEQWKVAFEESAGLKEQLKVAVEALEKLLAMAQERYDLPDNGMVSWTLTVAKAALEAIRGGVK